ncbi:unnamed protein product, partial [Hapterophycus canaliculatus]
DQFRLTLFSTATWTTIETCYSPDEFEFPDPPFFQKPFEERKKGCDTYLRTWYSASLVACSCLPSPHNKHYPKDDRFFLHEGTGTAIRRQNVGAKKLPLLF